MSLIRNIVRETRDMIPSVDPTYGAWFAAHRATPEDLAQQRATFIEGAPSFDIIVLLRDTSAASFHEMLDYVLAQSYDARELILVDGNEDSALVPALLESVDDERIRLVRPQGGHESADDLQAGIAAAEGDYVCFLDPNDLIEPDALFRYAEAASTLEAADILYCDEDVLSGDGGFSSPSFKPAFDRDLLYVHDYIGHFLAVRKSLLEQVDPPTEGTEGARGYDLVLRCVAEGAVPVRIPRVLYHRRSFEASTDAHDTRPERDAHEAGRRALQHHFDTRGIAATVEDSTEPLVYRVRYELSAPAPSISIIIPNKDGADLLRACVDSVYAHTAYPNFDVLIVENNSDEIETFALYEELEAAYENLRIIRWTDAFNYAAIVNFGASQAHGDLLLFLNNDTRVITSGWLEEMAGFFARPEVGVVGAKLLYEDDTIQHAGIVIGQYDTVVHLNVFRPRGEAGYLGRAQRPQNFSAVTGACQMTRAELFEEIGGYDEHFTVGFNDVDFCLRAAEAGYLTVWTPFAELYHAESATRGRDEDDPAKRERYQQELTLFKSRWARLFEEGDPYLNPNLKRASNYFTLPCPSASGKLRRLSRVLGRTAHRPSEESQ